MAPAPHTEQPTPSFDRQLALDAKEELPFLLRGIEETARHARGILFVFVSTVAFILTAAFSSYDEGTITLPIINANVPRSEFFFVAPPILLLVYTYLQIYIQELIGRLRRLESFLSAVELDAHYPEDMLFPWILVFGRQGRSSRLLPGSGGSRGGPEAAMRVYGDPIPFTRYFAVCLIWLLGPFALLLLSIRFLTDVNEVAIVPSLCFAISLIIAGRFIFETSTSHIIIGIVGLLFVFLTLASIPELRRITYLDVVWELASPVLFRIVDLAPMVLLYGIVTLLPIVAVALVVRLVFLRLSPWHVYLDRFSRSLQPIRLNQDTVGARHYITRRLVSAAGEEFPDDALVNRLKSAILLAEAGGGKTAMLRHIGLTIARTKKKKGVTGWIPIFVRLSHLQGGNLHPFDYTTQSVREYGIEISERIFRKNLHRFVYLMDGFDEVPMERRKEIVRMIRELIAMDVGKVFVTARTSAYRGELDGVVEQVLALEPIDKEGVRKFVKQNLSDSPERVDEFLRFIESDQKIEGLARSPVGLLIMLGVFRRWGERPTVTSLVRGFIHMQLEERATGSLVEQGFTRDQKLGFLKDLARRMDEESLQRVPVEAALAVAEKFLSRTGSEANPTELLKEGIRSGLLMEDGEGVAFTHLMIQENLVNSVSHDVPTA